ncbi:hypothetical protein [Cloacibacillus evryensis]|uniref:hypothetical protein n=1 Tax=Cloacibacillus evryensis TaxID=508460 RepID=UPI002B20804A|nr:hypothetical protein [Cloacibacillus evryensis]MEA5034238.1 hypothetical protein [Cloacibacillus evryensis]
MPGLGEVIVISEQARDVRYNALAHGVITAGERGFPGAVNQDSLAHTRQTDNPHEVGVTQVKASAGQAGKWIVAGGTTDLVPLYPADVHAPVSLDETLKTDAAGSAVIFADALASPLSVDGHKVHLAGDTMVSKRCYYGTDAVGNFGFYKVMGQ